MGFSRARAGVAACVIAAGVVAVAVSGEDDTQSHKSMPDVGALRVETESTATYDRSFFDHWIDSDDDGCDTRAEVLMDESTATIDRTGTCRVTAGEWSSYYDATVITVASDVDVDHTVALAEAWRSGAWNWDGPRRRAYANDLDHDETLIAVSASSNRSKGDKDPDSWLPEHDRCRYVADWITVKRTWGLSIDKAERDALVSATEKC